MITEIVTQCISLDLLKRQAGLVQFQPGSEPIPEGVFITLNCDSWVGNVERISHSTTIDEGVRIGDHSLIGPHVKLKEYANLGDFVWVGNGVEVEVGAQVRDGCKLSSGSTIGAFAVLQQGVEVNYDETVPMGACVTN